MKAIRMNIRSAQNVRTVLISRKKTSQTQLGLFLVNLSMGRTNGKNVDLFDCFPWWSTRVLFTQFGVMCWCHIDLRSCCIGGNSVLTLKPTTDLATNKLCRTFVLCVAIGNLNPIHIRETCPLRFQTHVGVWVKSCWQGCCVG